MVFMNIKFFFNSGDSVFECPICYKNLAENKNPDNIKFIQEQHDSFNQIFYFFDSECLNKIKKTNPITNNNIQNIISFSELNQRQISCFKDNAEAANKEIYIQKSSELNESQFNTESKNSIEYNFEQNKLFIDKLTKKEQPKNRNCNCLLI